MDKFNRISKKIADRAEELIEPTDYYNAVKTGMSVNPPNNIQMLYRWKKREVLANANNLYHRRYVLNLVLDGPGRVCINDEMFELEKDSLLLLFPFQFHYYITRQDNEYRWLVITFDEVDPVPAELRRRPVKLSMFGYSLVEEILETYLEQEISPDPILALKLSSCVNCLLNEMRNIARLNPKPTQVLRDSKMTLLERICGYINHNLSQPMTVHELALKHGISEGYLSALFSRLIGCGPGEYIRKVKINRAVDMLNTGKYMISDIAEQTGFSSPAVFSRTFKAVTGNSPREFTKN